MNKNLHIKCSKCKINEPVQYLELNYEDLSGSTQGLVCFCKECYNFDLLTYKNEVYDKIQEFSGENK